MSAYWDASALIAAVVEDEEHHESAFEALASARADCTSTHALAEVFAILTSGRLTIQISPEEAFGFIDANFQERLKVMPLSLDDYREAMRRSHAAGARGGAIYDMLHLQCARRAKVKKIYTINLGHFRTFGPDLREMISVPGA